MSVELSVGQMASLMGLTRQTLIYYHKISLFVPHHIDEHGNRIYTSLQIPTLREICVLKSLGIPLEEIRLHLQHRSPSTAIALLEARWQEAQREIDRQISIQKAIEKRLVLYRKGENLQQDSTFTLEYLPQRKAVFQACRQEELNKSSLHMISLALRRRADVKDLVLPGNFGFLIRREALDSPAPLQGAGPLLILPNNADDRIEYLEIPEGMYFCMYKTGMPYDLEALYYMLSVAKQRGYRLLGDVLDMALLDNTFYAETQITSDFCQLQIRIE